MLTSTVHGCLVLLPGNGKTRIYSNGWGWNTFIHSCFSRSRRRFLSNENYFVKWKMFVALYCHTCTCATVGWKCEIKKKLGHISKCYLCALIRSAKRCAGIHYMYTAKWMLILLFVFVGKKMWCENVYAKKETKKKKWHFCFSWRYFKSVEDEECIHIK